MDKIRGCIYDQDNTSAVLTSNEEFVIMMGGYGGCFYVNDLWIAIFVLDIRNDNEYILYASNVKLPQISQSGRIVLRDIAINKCLVFGWIKELFKSSNFQDLAIPPMEGL